MTGGQAVFLASLPTGKNGKLIPGHTTWDQLGPATQERYERMYRVAIEHGLSQSPVVV